MQILIRTLLSEKPKISASIVAALGILALGIMSVGTWREWFGPIDRWIATPETVFGMQEYWRLFTATLIHANREHLMSNLLAFGVLSFMLAGYFGYLVYPLSAFFFGAVANALTLLTYPPRTGLLGASGIVYWMGGFWVTLYLFVDRRFSLPNRVMRSVGFTLLIFIPTSYAPNVAYLTHTLGFVLGVVYGSIYFAICRKKIRRAEVYFDEIDSAQLH